MLISQPGERAPRGVLLLPPVRSSTNIASLAALNGSSRGADRTHGFFGGGSASNNACRIVGRPTRWRHASSRINRSSRRASRRIANSNHNCVH
jgi:hypothetical protein